MTGVADGRDEWILVGPPNDSSASSQSPLQETFGHLPSNRRGHGIVGAALVEQRLCEGMVRPRIDVYLCARSSNISRLGKSQGPVGSRRTIPRTDHQESGSIQGMQLIRIVDRFSIPE